MQAKGLWRACYGPFIADHLPGDRKNRLKFADAKNPGSTKAVCSTKPIDLNDIKMIKSQLSDATVNDVLMTLTCLTLRNYFAKYEPSTLKQSVRANMPISMRKEGDEDACPLSNTLKRIASESLVIAVPCNGSFEDSSHTRNQRFVWSSRFRPASEGPIESAAHCSLPLLQGKVDLG